jgi:uncharacterized protein YdeI (YjbR/CyaY-like superfamily)
MNIDPVNAYIQKHPRWQSSLLLLRQRLLQAKLQEKIKWGMPTYCINNNNLIGLGAFKHHFGLWFFSGSAIDDSDKVLINAQQGKTKHMRQWRFTLGDELNIALIDDYIQRAILAHQAKQAE